MSSGKSTGSRQVGYEFSGFGHQFNTELFYDARVCINRMFACVFNRVNNAEVKLKMAQTQYTLEEPRSVAERITKGNSSNRLEFLSATP